MMGFFQIILVHIYFPAKTKSIEPKKKSYLILYLHHPILFLTVSSGPDLRAFADSHFAIKKVMDLVDIKFRQVSNEKHYQ